MNHEVGYKMELAVCGAADRAQPEGMASRRALGRDTLGILRKEKGQCGFREVSH